MKKGIIIILITAAVAVALVFAYKNWNKPEPTNTTTQNTTNNTSDQTQTEDTGQAETDQANLIEYDGNNFTPNQLTVDAGTTITIKNLSSKNLQFDSDPHPAHTDNTELNVGVVAPGQSKTFIITKKGTFGYHNHLNTSDTGTIVVL